MIDLKQLEVWFVTGSQHLYGPAALKKVAANSQQVAQALNSAPAIPGQSRFQARGEIAGRGHGALPAGEQSRRNASA